MSAELETRHYDVIHLSTVHQGSDIRIYRKECTALHAAGVSVGVVARGPAPSGAVPWFELPIRPSRLGRMIRAPLDAWRVVRRLDPRVLHIHDPELIPLALLWRRRTGGRIIFDAHEDLPKQVMSKPYLRKWARPVVAIFARWLQYITARRFDGLVAATPSIEGAFAPARKMALVQNFPWLSDYPEPASLEDVKPTTTCYVGGISRIRGSAVMVRALTHTRNRVSLRVAGRRDDQSQADLDLLGDRLDDGGELTPEGIPQFIGGASVGLVLLEPAPNYLDSQPTKLFEYMAAGRPFVASDFDYWRDIVGRFDCGIFVDVSDVQAVAAVLDGLADQPDEIARLGANGRRAFERNFTFEGEAFALVKLTRDLLS